MLVGSFRGTKSLLYPFPPSLTKGRGLGGIGCQKSLNKGCWLCKRYDTMRSVKFKYFSPSLFSWRYTYGDWPIGCRWKRRCLPYLERRAYFDSSCIFWFNYPSWDSVLSIFHFMANHCAPPSRRSSRTVFVVTENLEEEFCLLILTIEGKAQKIR